MKENNLSYYQDLYKNTIRKDLLTSLGLKNVHQVPKLQKIVINMGVADAVSDNKVLNQVQEELSRIAGQHAVKTSAKRSIASFKIREGMKIGVKVTLRKKRMYEFLERLINIALPRVRDFRGLSKRSFDQFGNYNFGIKEHVVFPEVDYVSKTRGMDICMCIQSQGQDHSLGLLRALNFPINEER